MITKKYWDKIHGKVEETRKQFDLPKTETSLLRTVWKWLRIVFWMITR